MLKPLNPQNPKTQIPRYKFKWTRGGEAHRSFKAAARHQGRSQRMTKKIPGFMQL